MSFIDSDLPILRDEAPQDEAFLLEVYSSTREEELSATGWPSATKEAFLGMQFKAMRQGYQAVFLKAEFSIIQVGETSIGRIVVNRTDHEIRLVDIALLPNWRSRGIGALLIRKLLSEATDARKVATLQVQQNNRAARLYERLGFQLVEQSGIYQCMSYGNGADLVNC